MASRELSKVSSIRVALILYLSLLGILLLTPNTSGQGAFWGLFSVTGLEERILNLLLFVPMPVLLQKSFLMTSLTLLAVVGVSVPVFVEFAQRFIPGRVSDLFDAITNSTGFLVSLWIMKKFQDR